MDRLVVAQLITEASEKYPQQGVWEDNTFTAYPELLSRAVQLADAMAHDGIRKGTIVGVLDVNSRRYLEIHYALAFLGAVIHPVNFRLSLNDLEYTLRQAGDEWLFIGPTFASLAEALKPIVPRQVAMPRDYEALLSQGGATAPTTAVSETDPYSFCFTTGTSGRPKAVIYRHRDVILSALQMVHHMAMHDTPAHLGMNEVLMPLIPFYHINGWGIPLIAPYIGASSVMFGKISPKEQIDLIKRHAVTWCNMVPTQLHRLLEALSAPFPEPLKVLTGGSAVTSGLAHQAKLMNLKLSVIYGGSDQLATAISAVPPRAGISTPERASITTSRVLPLPMVEMTIRDADGAVIAPDGLSTGEIWVKSPWLPRSYVKDPQASYDSYQGGFFVTGDLGIGFPDGTFAIVDRLNDAVKSGGEWIPTSYLETVISEIDGIDQVAVLPSSDPKWGERPVAVVQTHLALEPEVIIQYLLGQVELGRLAKFWIPDRIFYVHDMPLTSAGKIHKRNLMAKLEQTPEYPQQA